MLSYFLLAALLGAVSADHHKVTCNSITPLKDISAEALKGNWIAVESVGFKDGHAFNPENLAEDKRTKTCLYAQDSDVSDTGMTIKLEANIPGKDKIVETTTLTFVGEEKGRMTMKSDLHDRDNWEFLVIDANPAKHLVYVLCQPPNEAGERLPERVNLMSRHGDHEDHESLSHDEIAALETNIAKTLGIAGQGIKPVKYATDCWASYGEN